jgi:hypothetical protein
MALGGGARAEERQQEKLRRRNSTVGGGAMTAEHWGRRFDGVGSVAARRSSEDVAGKLNEYDTWGLLILQNMKSPNLERLLVFLTV